jgi:hypothetical protein
VTRRAPLVAALVLAAAVGGAVAHAQADRAGDDPAAVVAPASPEVEADVVATLAEVSAALPE